MDRRAYLARLAAGSLAAAAGCVGAQIAEGDLDTPPPSPESALPSHTGNVELPVPKDDLVPAINSAIPAIVTPVFARDWSGVEIEAGSTTYEPRLRPMDPIIGVERGETTRAYPLAVLERHEVVNDSLPPGPEPGGEPLLVTYCPSCGSSMTALRRIGGEVAVFEVSHFLWRSNLVLRDLATESLWSQILATAIRGPATGEQLTLVPSTLTTWESWQGSNPDTEVLLPPPLSETIWAVHARSYSYDRFTESAAIIGEDDDVKGTGRTLVIGIQADGEAKAYPFEAVAAAGVVNDVVGDVPVVVAVATDGTLVAYDRRVDGDTLRFRRGEDSTLRAGCSRWLVGPGIAIDGPYDGVTLRRANELPPLFKFAWVDFYPDTGIYGEGA